MEKRKMSREIKFRAWDEGSKRYGEVVEIEYNESREIDGIWVWYNIHERYEPIPGANVTVEQYTGLKDKNGKEICEGDILQIDDHILGDFVVVWHNFGWKIKRSVGYESLSVHKSEDCTVIGNIHENPELLEDK